MSNIIRDFKVGETLRFSLQYDSTDLTGVAFYLYLRSTEDGVVTNDLEFTTTAGDHADDDPVNGYVVVEVPAATTATLTAGKYYVQLDTLDGAVRDTIVPVGCVDTVNVCSSLVV